MLLLIFLIGVANFFWGERIPVNSGLGWDGTVYSTVTADLEQLVISGRLNVLLTARILPCVIVHYGLCGLGLSLTVENIIRGFEVYNLALLLLACAVWTLIASELRLSTKGRWLGFTALFVNYAVLKQTFYYPVLIDATTFTLGVLLLYFYLKDSTAGMCVTLFASAFTWPQLVYPATLLLILPRRPARNPTAQAGAFPRMSAGVIAGLFAVILSHVADWEDPQFAEAQVAPTFGRAVIVSAALCVLYLFVAIRTLLAGLTVRSIGETLASWREMRVVPAVGVVVLSQIVIRALSAEVVQYIDPAPVMLRAFVQLPISRPLIFLLSHIIYFGPTVILLILYWSATCEKIRACGLGMVLFVLAQLVMALDPESRHLIHAWPFFVVFLVQVAEDQTWKPGVYMLLALISLLFCKAWLPIHMPPEVSDPLAFPFQRYYMNHGPWMSTYSYLVQGIAVLITGILLFRLTKRTART